MRIERVVLEHHRNVALFRLDIVDDAIADRNGPRGDVFEPGEHPQQGRLAATGGADQHDELAIIDRNRHAVQNFKIAERLPHVANLYRRHRTHSLIAVLWRRGWAAALCCLFDFNAGSRIQPSSSSAVWRFLAIRW